VGARRRRAEDFRACGALSALRPDRSTRTLGITQMRRALVPIGLTLLAVALLLAILRIVGSNDRDYSHWEGARLTVADSIIREYGGSSDFLYVGFEERDPFPEELALFSASNARLRFKPYSERTAAEDWCEEPGFRIGPCRKDNFLIVSFRAMLLWRTALVEWQTTACHGSYLAVFAFGKWRAIEEPTMFCV